MREQHKLERTSKPDDAPIPLEEPVSTSPPRRPAVSLPQPLQPPSGAMPKLGTKPPVGRQSVATVCPKCRYDIRDLKGDRCPECGTDLLPAIRAAERKTRARGELKSVYKQAIIAMLLSFAAMAVLLLLMGEIGAMPIYLIKWAVFVPLGLIVFAACSAVWIGFDQPFGITALRLAAIYAIADTVGLAMDFLPLSILGLIVPTLVYIGLLIKWLELDTQDAVILAVITGAVRAVLTLSILAMLLN